MSAYRHPTTRRPNSQQKPVLQQTENSNIVFWCPFFCDLTGLFLFLLNTIRHAQYTNALSASAELAKVTRPLDFGREPLQKKSWSKRESRELKRNANKLYCFSTQLEFFLLNHLVVNTWMTWWACARRLKIQGESFFRVLGPCRCASISGCRDVNLKLRLWLTIMKVKQRMSQHLRWWKQMLQPFPVAYWLPL